MRQPKLKQTSQNDFVAAIQHLTEIIRKQQNKQCDIITTLAQLHVDYTEGSQGLRLFLDKQLK